MSAGKKPWCWWQKGALAGFLLLLVLLTVLFGFRRPWVQPLPGVRTEMGRPFLRESDLGPESAYRLLLRACEEPEEATAIRLGRKEWQWPRQGALSGWGPVLAKFAAHPWPPEGPTGVPPPEAADESAGDEEWVDAALAAPWTAGQYADIQRLVKECRPDLVALDQALAAPDPQMPTPDSLDFPQDCLRDVRSLAQYLAVSAQYKAATGDLAGACQDLSRILGMGNLVCRGGGMTCNGTGWICRSFAAEAAWQIAIRDPLPSAICWQLARSFLASADDGEPFAEALRVDLIISENTVADYYRAASFGLDMGVVGFSMSNPWGRRLQRTLFAILPLAGSTPERTRQNLRFWQQHVIALAEKPYSAATQAEYTALRARLPHPQEWKTTMLRVKDPMGCILAGTAIAGVDIVHRQSAFRLAQLDGTSLFLAVQACQKDHGVPPERLEQLVPDYLPRVPQDPFDGKSFRYLRSGVPGLPAGAWAVYSIGDDFTDDGGTAHSVGTCRDDAGPNPDLVWPSCPYPVPAE